MYTLIRGNAFGKHSKGVILLNLQDCIFNAFREVTDHIAKVEDKLNELQVNLPLVFETREDSIRVMNRIEDKLKAVNLFSNSIRQLINAAIDHPRFPAARHRLPGLGSCPPAGQRPCASV